jgi:hypothetical protein
MDHRVGRKTALPQTGSARPVPDGTGARFKAANDAHTEEHVADADKQLSRIFSAEKICPKSGPKKTSI